MYDIHDTLGSASVSQALPPSVVAMEVQSRGIVVRVGYY